MQFAYKKQPLSKVFKITFESGWIFSDNSFDIKRPN